MYKRMPQHRCWAPNGKHEWKSTFLLQFQNSFRGAYRCQKDGKHNCFSTERKNTLDCTEERQQFVRKIRNQQSGNKTRDVEFEMREREMSSLFPACVFITQARRLPFRKDMTTGLEVEIKGFTRYHSHSEEQLDGRFFRVNKQASDNSTTWREPCISHDTPLENYGINSRQLSIVQTAEPPLQNPKKSAGEEKAV